jgi:DNA-directed RNA polymerase III subunit RPC7
LGPDKSLFPEELWSTLEGEEGKAVRNTINKGIKKSVNILKASAKEKVTLNNFEKIKDVFEIDEAGVEGELEEDEEDAQEEEVDYDYEEDEAEMGGDYAAEQYFDGGEGDDDDDGMDGGRGDDF